MSTICIENPIVSYWNAIQNKEFTVSKKIEKTYRKLFEDVNNPGEFFYSWKRANHAIDFIELFCKHSKGKWSGQAVKLELWEKALIAATFGFIDSDGNRQYREVILIVGKKNGKSLLASAIGLYMMFADGEGGPEVYAVATKKDQAKIIWDEAKRMVKKSPALKKYIKPYVSELASEVNDGVFKPLASDSDTLDGLNVHCGLMDEIHQWKNGTALFDIIADGTTARSQPLIFITSTAGFIREDIYDDKYDEAKKLIDGYTSEEGYKNKRLLAFVYEIDSREEWEKPECWQKANPGLGTIKSISQLADKVNKAKEDPRQLRNLLCKEFNYRTNSRQAWLEWEEYNNEEVFDIRVLKPKYAIGGVDLSSTTDLTAAALIFRVPDCEKIFVEVMFWLPEDLLDKRVHEDKIRYDIWKEQGLLRTCEGNRVNYKDVVSWFSEMEDEYDLIISYIGYDAWSSPYFVDDLKRTFSKKVPEAVHQGKKTLSSPMKSLGADLIAKKIVYQNNPILKWCFNNTAYEEDKNGNIQPCKTSKATRRIDGFAALLDAYVMYENNLEEYLDLVA